MILPKYCPIVTNHYTTVYCLVANDAAIDSPESSLGGPRDSRGEASILRLLASCVLGWNLHIASTIGWWLNNPPDKPACQ